MVFFTARLTVCGTLVLSFICCACASSSIMPLSICKDGKALNECCFFFCLIGLILQFAYEFDVSGLCLCVQSWQRRHRAGNEREAMKEYVRLCDILRLKHMIYTIERRQWRHSDRVWCVNDKRVQRRFVSRQVSLYLSLYFARFLPLSRTRAHEIFHSKK